MQEPTGQRRTVTLICALRNLIPAIFGAAMAGHEFGWQAVLSFPSSLAHIPSEAAAYSCSWAHSTLSGKHDADPLGHAESVREAAASLSSISPSPLGKGRRPIWAARGWGLHLSRAVGSLSESPGETASFRQHGHSRLEAQGPGIKGDTPLHPRSGRRYFERASTPLYSPERCGASPSATVTCTLGSAVLLRQGPGKQS